MFKKYASVQLTSDFEYMLMTMEDVHPDLYSFVDKTEWQSKKAQIKSQLRDGMTAIDFIRLTGRLIPEIRDGHTFIMPWLDELEDDPDVKFFPLFLSFMPGESIVRTDYENRIFTNDELVSVNNIPTKTLVDEMLMYTSGEMMGFRYALLTKRFPVLLRIIFGIEPPYKVVIKHNSELYEHLLEGGKAKEVLAQIKAISQKEYSFEIKDSTGILTIPSFSLYKEDATRFKEFIDGVFLRLRESSAEHLIIDVRNNGGGDSRLSQYTADYLTEKPLKGFDRLIWKSSRQIREYVLDDITNNTNGFYNQCSYDYLTSVPEGESLHYPIEMSENPNKHKENTFHGKVLVLTNSLCFSSTVSFLTMIRDYKLGTIIGTTPGGLPNHFGDCYSFRLPHTDISCSVSQKKFVRSSGDETDNDLTPDFIIEQSPEDTQKNIDTVMEFSKNFQ